MRRLALLLLCGCNSGSGSVNNSMCPADQCPVSSALQLAAEVTPIATGLNSAPQPSQEVALISVDESNHFSVVLDRATTLGGTLVDHGTTVTGAIVLTRPSRIAGRPALYYQAQASPEGQWTAVVSPTHDGELYTVRVQPDDPTHRPPETFLITGDRDQTFALPLSDPASLLQIHGTITDALQLPVAGMTVQALDPDTRAAVSTTAVSDAQGNYALRLSLQTSSLLGSAPAPAALGAVQLVATPSQMLTWQPRLEMSVDVTHAGAANSLTENLQLPPLPTAAQLVYNVVGVGPSGKREQVASAQCQFTSDVSDPKSPVRAFYQVTVDTDANGQATVMLIPASSSNRDYQVSVSPPSNSEFQAITTMVTVGPAGGYGADIPLALRSQVTGKVLGPNGAPVKNLQVVPNPSTLALLAPSTDALAAKLSSALTDASGSFVLRVDDGSYDFGLIPPAQSQLPRQWLGGQVIGGDVVLAPFTLPPASPVSGQIEDALNLPLAGADVRLYLVPSRNAACATQDYACLSPPELIAESTVATDGSVAVLLPGTPPN